MDGMNERSPEDVAQRELDERCAHALGYRTIWADGGFGETLYLWDEEAIRDGNGARNCHLLGASFGRVRVGGEIRELMVRLCPAFSARLEDAKILEDEIERRGIEKEYIEALCKTIDPHYKLFINMPEPKTLEGLMVDAVCVLGWALIRATPEQRARAFVSVVDL